MIVQDSSAVLKRFGNFRPARPAGSQSAHELGHGRTAAEVLLLLRALK